MVHPPTQKPPIDAIVRSDSAIPEDLPARRGPDTGRRATSYHINRSDDSVVHLCACLPWGTRILQKIQGLGDGSWITAGGKERTPLEAARQHQQLENVRFLIRLSTESEHIAAIAAFLLVNKSTSCDSVPQAPNLAMQMLPS